ncbi:DUF1656 domain-containing protein [Ectopseudomonas mendocina]|uniref:DUF1656 domain-containing protein n=1 Tax=Ectopseudomonas mendocina TaxID=300 RepID=A0ABZ2RLM2_ECTME
MGLREWEMGGILFSPMLVFAVLALLVTFFLRWGIQSAGLTRWIWHEALFDCALYVCVLAVVVAVLGR